MANMTIEQKQPPEFFFEIGALKNFASFIVKYRCWSLFLIKLQAFRPKRFQHRCFPVKFAKFLRKQIMKNIYERLLLTVNVNIQQFFTGATFGWNVSYLNFGNANLLLIWLSANHLKYFLDDSCKKNVTSSLLSPAL